MQLKWVGLVCDGKRGGTQRLGRAKMGKIRPGGAGPEAAGSRLR